MTQDTLENETMNTTDMNLWTELSKGSQVARSKLLEDNLGLVHHIARQLSRTLTAKADLDDLLSAGTIGLMNALDGFDASRGLAFSTFAAPRIRGAILDGLRKQDHVPRSVRRKARELAQAREALQRATGRAPSDTEMAAQLGIDQNTYWKWEADVEGAVQISLDSHPSDTAGWGNDHASTTPIELFADETYGDIEEIVNHEQEVTHLRDAIMGLKEQERVVLSLYYFEELKLHEIAEVLSLTESRVSQIRSRALSKLRTELQPLRSAVA
ncbi:MAG TPA: FliA/WhiG family RNA polymerase sigma factor [Gemmatimonadaceae bacterium]|jgi:RNA polymerase sigma factor for flagellar operon FliA|nr:FliA/WhiG family RNA polymerase sigma factor [Gemmatimonadaceae bacterium]